MKAAEAAIGVLQTSKDQGTLNQAVETIQAALATRAREFDGLRMLLDRVTEDRVRQYSTALRTAIQAFPPQSQGRRKLVASVARACNNSSLIATAAGLSKKYVTNAVALKDKANVSRISSDSGRKGALYTHVKKAEGRRILMWVLSEASMRSGQKTRKTGVTLYTEQPIYVFYDKYRAEFFSLCLMEAKDNPMYVGNPPSSVSGEHEGNLWAAVWMSRQEGFDVFEYMAALQEEYVQERLQRGYAHRLDTSDRSDSQSCHTPSGTHKNVSHLGPKGKTSDHARGDDTHTSSESSSTPGRKDTKAARQRFDASTWKLIPRSYDTLMGYLASIDHETFPEISEEHKAWPAKWRGVTVLSTTDPKYCPVCENGAKHELRLKKLRDTYVDDGSFEQMKNYAEILQLEKKMEELHEHRSPDYCRVSRRFIFFQTVHHAFATLVRFTLCPWCFAS